MGRPHVQDHRGWQGSHAGTLPPRTLALITVPPQEPWGTSG